MLRTLEHPSVNKGLISRKPQNLPPIPLDAPLVEHFFTNKYDHIIKPNVNIIHAHTNKTAHILEHGNQLYKIQ